MGFYENLIVSKIEQMGYVHLLKSVARFYFLRTDSTHYRILLNHFPNLLLRYQNNNSMFGLFKKKSPKQKLEKKYEQLQKEAFELSKTNRKLSDQKQAEAQEVLKEIEALEED